MSKAYSNKALPAGTIIREWRLEDVLGVGGFGIVYKGRGIYFGELVAIKEYFPSSISERDAEDTVVPIGSDVEEVHALGLKKFVEEAKLLWNLSTPTRHPNIVSVRSLFQIHGTAYMVMDFEDGVSLSKLLKEGRRFNERSLWNIIQPVAEGLDRAHRVGVLHRDIKPPNILITEDNRPVLIDFGSARFEAAEATSTSVTFHTPPYAAIEQYVKTYDQGPWTDVYALAVVLYECVTGEKPPEVLERLHGGLGKPLAEGTWPGFGKRFLQAIDAGMTIRPTERPQSIREWLALFGKKGEDVAVGPDEEPTRFFAHEMAVDEIVPVPPPAPGFEQKALPDTPVPNDPSEVQFKLAGQETGASKKAKKEKASDSATAPAIEEKVATPAAEGGIDRSPVKEKPAAPPPDSARAPALAALKDKRKAWLVGAGALALGALVAGGSFLLGGKNSGSSGGDEPISIPGGETNASGVSDIVALAPAERALAEEARKAGAAEAAVSGLVTAGEQIDAQLVSLQALLADPTQADAAAARTNDLKRTATSANVEFSNALLRDAEGRARRFPADALSSPAGANMASALASLRASVQAAAGSTDAGQSLTAARDALAKSQAFNATLSAVHSAQVASKRPSDALALAPRPNVAATTPVAQVATPVAAAPAAAASSSSTSLSPAKKAQFNSIIGSGRGLAQQVIRMGGSQGTATQKANAQLAKNYDKYLANLADSFRGVTSDREADGLIKKANQTKAYIVFLNKQSSQGQ